MEILTALYFAFLFVVFSLGQLTRIGFGSGVAVTVLDITVGIGVSLWLFNRLLRKSFSLPQAKLFLLFVSICIISLGINLSWIPTQFVFVGLLYLIRFAVYGLLFYVAYTSSSRVKQYIQHIMVFSGGVILLGGFLQFFLYPSLRNLLYAGWDEHLYRMFGTFFDPNFLGIFLVCYFLFISSFFLESLHKKHFQTSFWWGLLLLTTLIGIVLTYSRSALLALICGVGAFLIFKGQKRFILVSIGGILLVGIFSILMLGKTSEGTNLLRKTSTGARLGNTQNALKIFVDHPLLGVGFDTYGYAQHTYGIFKGSGWQEGHGTAGADNSFLFVLATTGVIGFSTFLLFIWTHIRSVSKSKNMLREATLATCIALGVGSFFVNGLFYPSLLLWIWVLLGITENR